MINVTLSGKAALLSYQMVSECDFTIGILVNNHLLLRIPKF